MQAEALISGLMTAMAIRCRELYEVCEDINKEQNSALGALMLSLGCSAIGMLHAAYEESFTRVPTEASGSMRPLAAENKDRYHGTSILWYT